MLDSPSIEYWFLLHFVRTTRDFPTATDVIAELRRHWPGYSKQSRKLDWFALIEKTEPAMQNAAYVRRMRRGSRVSRPLADMDVLAAKLGSMSKQSIPHAEDKVPHTIQHLNRPPARISIPGNGSIRIFRNDRLQESVRNQYHSHGERFVLRA